MSLETVWCTWREMTGKTGEKCSTEHLVLTHSRKWFLLLHKSVMIALEILRKATQNKMEKLKLISAESEPKYFPLFFSQNLSVNKL